MSGKLKSWAVPKKPPLKPKVRRLAMQVEDHEMDYADFEGTIADGEYGAGQVRIWDKGIYEEKQVTHDKMEIIMHGKKLNGVYVLFKFPKAGPRAWLFFKVMKKRGTS